MVGKEYSIQPGDNFHELALRWGGTCDDFILVNPEVDPLKLQIGQKIILPDFKGLRPGQELYADLGKDDGQEFVGEYLDDVQMEVEGVRLRLRRLGEPKTPHEIHFILPRTEIRKIQSTDGCGPSEVQIMLSNLNVVLSPRLMSGDGDTAEQGKAAGPTSSQAQVSRAPQQQQLQAQQTHQIQQTQSQQQQFGPSPQYGHSAQPKQGQSKQPRWRLTFPFNKR